MFRISLIVTESAANTSLSAAYVFVCMLSGSGGFPGGSVVKNLPVLQDMQEMGVRPLGLEDPLEREMAGTSRILAERDPADPGARQASVHRVARSQM